MPYTTVVPGTAITASWGNANVRDQVVTPFANATARDSAITSPVEGMLAYLSDVDKITYYSGSAWQYLVPLLTGTGNQRLSLGTLTSGTYTPALTGVSELSVSISAPVSGRILVMWTAAISNTNAGDWTYVSVEASGGYSMAASDEHSIRNLGTSTRSHTAQMWLPPYGNAPLTPGDTVTIKLSCRVSGNTGNVDDCWLTALPA